MTHDELKAAHAAGAWIYGIEDDGKLHRIEEPQWICPADRYVALVPYIAELGQEAGAVDPVAMRVVLPRGSTSGWESYDAERAANLSRGWTVELAYSSPAHTSEARDAERYRWLRKNAAADLLNLFADEWDFFGNDADQLDAGLDAAMRQEGGNG